MIEYREISKTQLTSELFQDFERLQIVDLCLRNIHGTWMPVHAPFTVRKIMKFWSRAFGILWIAEAWSTELFQTESSKVLPLWKGLP